MEGIQNQFLAAIEAFLAKKGMTPTQFGKGAVNDPNFVADLRRGRSTTTKVADRVMAFMREHEATA